MEEQNQKFENDVYEKLRSHLDSMPVGLPKTESGVEIRLLKQLFSPEEAGFALRLGVMPVNAKKVYRHFKKKGYSLEQVQNILDGMIKKGLLNGGKGKEGKETYYSVAFMVVGLYEYRVNRLTKEFALDFRQYMEEGFREEILASKIPQLRTVPIKESLKTIEINETLENKKIVLPYDDIDHILDSASDFISVANCVCRQEKDLLGEGCDHPKEVCFQFGGAAHYYVDNGMGRQVSKEEAKKIIKKAQELGLVLQPSNTQRISSLCCCCGCSCEVLSNARKLDKPAQYFASNYYSQVNRETCVGCGTCEDACPMDAITVGDDDLAEVNLDRCIGCGVCLQICPNDSIQLIPKEKSLIPPKNMLELYKKISVSRAK